LLRFIWCSQIKRRRGLLGFLSLVQFMRIRWSGRGEQNDCYSAKSSYKLAMQSIIRSDKFHVQSNWKDIWKGHVQHKARHLLWRVCMWCLPTRCQLLERNVDCEIQYPLCEEEAEDVVQTFFTCASAWSSWQAAELLAVIVSAVCQQGSAADRLFALCQNEDYATISRVAMLFWSIWHNQNDKIWNDNARLPSQVGWTTFDHWNEWFVVHKIWNTDDHYVPHLSTWRWGKHRIEWLKCNIDVTFFVASGKTTMGAWFRNSSGEFIAGFTHWKQLTLSTEEGEAWALL
jgi:hypothetical protein